MRIKTVNEPGDRVPLTIIQLQYQASETRHKRGTKTEGSVTRGIAHKLLLTMIYKMRNQVTADFINNMQQCYI